MCGGGYKRYVQVNPIRDWLRRLRIGKDHAAMIDFSMSGCVSRLEWLLAFAGLVMIVAFATARNTAGLVVTIAILLLGVLLVVFAGGPRD